MNEGTLFILRNGITSEGVVTRMVTKLSRHKIQNGKQTSYLPVLIGLRNNVTRKIRIEIEISYVGFLNHTSTLKLVSKLVPNLS